MSGHHGYKHAGRSDLPKATFTINFAPLGGEVAMQFGLLSSEIARAAKELKCTPREALTALRGIGCVDCTDEQAETILALMLQPLPSPPTPGGETR